MIDNLLPPPFAAAGIALTYYFCVRPMRQGRTCHKMPQQPRARSSRPAGTADAEIARLREEVQFLSYELDARSGGDAVRPQKDESR